MILENKNFKGVYIMKEFKDMTVAELDALMEAVKEARKVAVKAEVAEVEAEAREYLAGAVKGDIVTVIFKGERTDAKFVGLTDKRFTVEIDGAKKSIMLDKLVL